MNWKLQATKEMVPFFLYHYFQKWEITNIFLLEKQLKNILDTNLLIMFIGSVDTYPFKDVISKIESLDFVFSMTELKEEKYPDIFDIYTQIKNSFMPTA
ncbi:MAG: hypothetical protein LBQ31_03245 [Bacteroidales bacterium]|nr:hypothetical protein [Bacteroidales bacterium]